MGQGLLETEGPFLSFLKNGSAFLGAKESLIKETEANVSWSFMETIFYLMGYW